MFKPLLIVSLMLLPMQAFSQSSSAESPSSHTLTFQVIQDELVLDNTTVKSAQLIEVDRVYKGLNVELKPKAAGTFAEMTQAGIGRRMNLVFNKVVITSTVVQTSLGGNFLIQGISKQDAQAFLNVLNANKPKVEEEPPV